MRNKVRNRDDEEKTEDMNIKPSFFKLLSDRLSSKIKSRIPPKFLRKLNDFSNEAILRVSSGCSWSIRLSKTREGVFMKEGWEKFLKDNSLGDNEFLIFTYEGKMCFTVQIFKKNCLEWLDLPEEATKSKAPRKRPVGVREMIIIEESDYELLDFPETDLRCKKGRKMKKMDKRKIKTKTRARGCETSSGDGEEIQIIGETGLRCMKQAKSTNEKTPGFRGDTSASSSGFPQFITKMTKTYVHQTVTLPKCFATTYLPGENTKFVLWDPEGNQWKVAYNEKYRTFTSGWPHFVRGNKLKIGDTCRFVFVAPEEMRVHITRLEEEQE